MIRKIFKKSCYGVLLTAMVFGCGMTAQAKGDDTVKNGVFAENVDLGGKTRAEAKAAVEAYVEDLKQVEVTLLAADNNEVKTTIGAMGITWTNPEIIDEAMELGAYGNVIERYKMLKDLEHDNYVFDLEFDYDVQAINNIIAEEATKYDQEAINYELVRENDAFKVIEGQNGYQLDVETSIDLVYDYLIEEWDYQACSIPLDVIVDEPKGSAEQLAEVKDVLGSFTTSYKTSNSSRSANVANGSNLINGITLYPGEEFSTYEAVSPFTQANGYYMAGSYLNGKVVDSLGGGICQVSTTLYNAVLKSELEITERHNHSMIVSYVDPSADAAIAESSGKDFKFKNNLDYPVYIESYVKDKKITINIYGKETRPANREVVYESQVLEVIRPQTDAIYPDAGQPIGYIITESAHIGYKAKLWKVVKEDGVEVSREQINSSNYKMTPRSATVGVATADPVAYNEIMAAIGTASIDHVKNVIAILTAPPAPAEPEE